MINIKCGDCLELMKDISDKSIDMILCDPPYGTTCCFWDKVIPFEPLWQQYKRIIKDNGAILLFSSQPFTTDLINSNRKMFRYEIIWEKTSATGVLNARRMPLKAHENILVFYKHLPTYNAQMITLTDEKLKQRCAIIGRKKNDLEHAVHYGKCHNHLYTDTGKRFPRDVIKFSNANGVVFGKATANKVLHPSGKPITLLEYLIKTYSNEGDTVLDNCMGSGSTGVACINTNRNFIGYELNEDYFKIAQDRIDEALKGEQATPTKEDTDDRQLTFF